MADLLSIDKNSTALVVIDLQKGITALPIEPRSATEVIANASKLLKAFRQNDMPVFLVHVGPSSDFRDGLSPLSDRAMPNRRSLPPDWMEFVPELNKAESDFVIHKRQWGAFYGTELDLQLRRRKLDTIVLCGISTNIGVESTARFAYEYGYQQVFAEDACGASSGAEHELSMKTVFSRMGRVRSTNEILDALA